MWVVLVVIFPSLVSGLDATLEQEGGQFEAKTAFYAFALNARPLRVTALQWDPEGKGQYEPVVQGQKPNTPWVNSLFVGIRQYTDTLAGDAKSLNWDPAGKTLTVRDIYLTDDLKGDWAFTFTEDTIVHQITWKARKEMAVKNVGHQWTGGAALGVRGTPIVGDKPDFPGKIYLGPAIGIGPGMEMALENKGFSASGIYAHPHGVVFQNLGPLSQGGTLPQGSSDGGKWTLSASLLPAAKDHNSFAEFHHPGHYMKDHHIEKVGNTYHLIYNVGTNNLLGWTHEGQEDTFGHATSTDLMQWTVKEPVFHKIPGGWEGATISAPSILPVKGRFVMAYTGFASHPKGHEQMGIAYSDDLLSWKREAANPVMSASQLPWLKVNEERGSNFRDPHIIAYKDGFIAYNTIQFIDRRDVRKRHLGGISMTFSKDLIHWEDRGMAYEPIRGIPESCCVWRRDDWYYLITSISGATLRRSRDPLSNSWEELPWRLPTPAYYGAYEVFNGKERDVLSAFFHKQPLNFLQLWHVDYDADGVPYVEGCPEL